MEPLPSTYYHTNGIRLHAVTAGPEDGKPVILLHGFPEFWYSWRKQIQPLGAAGFRVIAPDQRGYNLSDKPEGVGSYQLDLLVEDIVGIIRRLHEGQVHVVGHDWGAAVAWTLAIQYPELVDRLVILNVPHPGVDKRLLRTIPRQLFKSWYIGFFQIPKIPELLLKGKQFAGLERALVASSRPGTFRLADLQQYRQAWSQEHALTSMLNWYRAMLRMPPSGLEGVRLEMPVRMLWGVRDVALSRELAAYSIDLCDNGRLTYFENATHWLHHEEPEEVNRLMIAFLSETESKGATEANRQNPHPLPDE
jgi:epoxide hydrolase 4